MMTTYFSFDQVYLQDVEYSVSWKSGTSITDQALWEGLRLLPSQGPTDLALGKVRWPCKAFHSRRLSHHLLPVTLAVKVK